MADMLELIARLEAAKEGGRELDGLVARAFGWHRVEPRFARNKHGGWIAPEDFIGLYSDGSPKLDGLHGTTIHRDPPRLTTSLDAALALAERVLEPVQGLGLLHAVIDLVGGNGLPSHRIAPLFCAAILKAKAQGEGG